MTIKPIEEIQEQLFHSRERRRSLAGVPEMSRTHRFGNIPETLIDTDVVFPVRTGLVTFWTAIRILANGGVHQGLVFEFGGTSNGATAWIDDDQIGFRAGDAAAADRGFATFTTGTGELPVGLEMDLVFAVRPGDGRVRIWGNGKEIARDVASGGSLPSGWSGVGDGSFAAAQAVSVPADVPQNGAPNGFEVIQPLSVFIGQVPRHFV